MDVWILAVGFLSCVLSLVIVAFLTSLKKSYSIKKKHVMVWDVVVFV